MAKTKTDPKQQAIDEGWRLYNTAMEACEELSSHLQELEDDHDVDVSKASEAAYSAHTALEEAYSSGSRILPAHTNDK